MSVAAIECRLTSRMRHTFDELAVGMSEEFTHTITEKDIEMYAHVTGDDNPIHMDEEFAVSTRFGRRIAHGLISVGFFSALFGTRLPGPGAVYVAQNVRFKNPVFIDETVRANVTITDINPLKRRVYFSTTCWVGEKCVVEGEAEIYIPSDQFGHVS